MSRPKTEFVPLSSRKLRKQSLREQAVNVLKRHIVEANLRAGDKLPPERDLSQGLAVSRTVVRESLAALEAEGWVEHGPSTGYFITQEATRLPAQSAANVQSLVQEALEVRLSIEIGIAGMLADRVTDEQLDELETQASELDLAMDRNEAHAELELGFHLAVWATVENDLLVALGRQILGDYFRALALAHPDMFYRPTQSVEARRHRPIVQALRTRDSATIQAALIEHCRLPSDLRIHVHQHEHWPVTATLRANGSGQQQ
jgi:GntR family transcriptional regulator, transcriptional repressor for pyruvate dehydrogenase complex